MVVRKKNDKTGKLYQLLYFYKQVWSLSLPVIKPVICGNTWKNFLFQLHRICLQ